MQRALSLFSPLVPQAVFSLRAASEDKTSIQSLLF